MLREKASVSIDGNWLESELKHYEWRQQTKFPVVKVISFTMVGRTA